MTDYTINGLCYHVVETGVGEPVVLLHGFTGSAATWRGLVARLAGEYRVIAVDLPGHGESDAPADVSRYRMEQVTTDLAALLTGMGAAPAHWLGYSMGGRLALYVAVHRPDLARSLILESASPGLADPAERQARREQDEHLAMRIETGGVAAFVAEWEQLPLFTGVRALPPDTQEALRQQRLANAAVGLAGSLRGMGTGAQPPLWDRLAAVKRPVLLLAGEQDERFVALNRRMAAEMPAARLAVIPGAGHTVHLEQPALFENAVLSFLQSLAESDGQPLAQGKEDGKRQRGQRHLSEPRVEGRQVIDAAHGQAITNEERQSQQIEELPRGNQV
jgi:2-succinyl-6-hydroxy-2,4-cyclohexadiene-1-carboxylate synthase